jgi:hypothetical protein
VRDYYTGESDDEKAKTQQKNSPKTKKFLLALLIICHKTTQLTEREFRRN